MDRHTFTLESFKNIQDLIKFADQKSSGVLVVAGLEITVFLSNVEKLVLIKNSSNFFAITTFLIGIITAILITATVYYSVFKVLRPQLAKHYYGTDASLFYFNHLAAMTDKTYLFEQFRDITDERMLRNLTDQIFEVSKILNSKINALHTSINLLLASIASLLIFIQLSRLT